MARTRSTDCGHTDQAFEGIDDWTAHSENFANSAWVIGTGLRSQFKTSAFRGPASSSSPTQPEQVKIARGLSGRFK